MRTYIIEGKPKKTVTIEVDGHSLTLTEGIDITVIVVVAAQQSAQSDGETIPQPTPDNQTTIERQVNDPWCKKCAGFHKPNEACY